MAFDFGAEGQRAVVAKKNPARNFSFFLCKKMATAVATIRVQRGARQLKTSLAELDSSLATLARHARSRWNWRGSRWKQSATTYCARCPTPPPRPRESVAEIVI